MSENNHTDNATDLRLCQGRDDEATTSTSTGSRGPRGKNAQYYRDYRARKRAEQEKESLNRTSDPSTTADSSTINVAPNFDFIVRFQRNEIRNAGVAIYHNQKNRCHIVTSHLDIKAPYSGNPDVTISTSKRIGDICAVECTVNHSENNPKKLILIAIYISPNAAMRDIKLFIAKSLLPLSIAGSQALADVTGEEIDYCERPVILAGDFNVNFSSPEAETLLTFLKDKFGLEMINGRNDPTTKGGTTIDAVFARNIEKIELKHFVSYFSYHNPIVNVIDLDISPLENDN